MYFIALILLLVSCSAVTPKRGPAQMLSKNILIVGDSHMAGPFGQFLHQSVSTNIGTNTITYGHANSLPLHWLSSVRFSRAGGVYHSLSAHKTINPNSLIRMSDPNPTDWRNEVEIPQLYPLVSNMNLHEDWSKQDFPLAQPDYVIIQLSPFARSEMQHNEAITNHNYEKYKSYIRELAQVATSHGARCLWIGPPNGLAKTVTEVNLSYQILTEALAETSCELVSSNHYKAMQCDGIHFNCREEMDIAKKWANEVAQRVKELIN